MDKPPALGGCTEPSILLSIPGVLGAFRGTGGRLYGRPVLRIGLRRFVEPEGLFSGANLDGKLIRLRG